MNAPSEGASRSPLLIVSVAAALLLTVVAVAAFVMQSPNASTAKDDPIATADPFTPPSSEGFVGSESCRSCHAEISEQYETSHPMWHALRASQEAAKEKDRLAATFAGDAGREYEVAEVDGKVRHIERLVDEQGKTISSESFDIAYVLGSGASGRSYVLERDGELFASPISWYASKDKWDLSPGYRGAAHPRFSRKLGERCLGCHSGRRNFAERPNDDRAKYASPVFLEEGIGCERCHGPGKEHIAHHSGQSSSADPIVNPAKLEATRRDAVCNQCHLQGDFLFYRPGRTDSDFRAGDRLSDVWLIFSRTRRNNDKSLAAVEQPEQMYSSVCFQKSEGRFSCISCHNPHYRPKPDEVAGYYRQRCMECHADQGCSETEAKQNAAPALGSCVHCHMPRRGASDIPHTSQTDHRVLRRPGASGEKADQKAASEPAKEVEFELFGAETDDLPQPVLDRAEGLKLARLASTAPTESRRQELAGASIEKLKVTVSAKDVEGLDYLAQAYYASGAKELARETWERALAADPGHTPSLSALLSLAEQELQPERALELLERLSEIEPWKADWPLARASILTDLGQRTAEAAEAAEAALKLDPTRLETYPLTINLLRRMGRFEDADRYDSAARRLVGVLSRQNPTPPEGPSKPGR